MTATTKPIRAVLATGVADVLRQVATATGEPHEAFVDEPWARSPAGSVDLFAEFSRHDAASIRLQETILRAGGLVLPVFLVPAARVPPFLAFVRRATVLLPDRSVVRVVHAGPGEVRAVGVQPAAVAAEVRGCHLLAGIVYPPDHPDAAAWRYAAASRGDGPIVAGAVRGRYARGHRSVRQARSRRGSR